jgi:zinc transport system substrate-binding protein
MEFCLMPARLLLLLFTLILPLHSAALDVFVSILPQKYLAERIGGAHIQVSVMVGPGKSPETYEPTPRQMQALAHAQIYFSLGEMSFERTWLPRIYKNNPNLFHVRTDRDIPLRTWQQDEGAGHQHHDHDHGHYDPHIWTSPPLALHIATIMRDTLQQRDPAHHDDYAANYADLAAELERLDEELKALLAPIKGKRFMIYHPAWGYFADSYGLYQIAIEDHGKEPGPKSLAHLITLAKKENIRVIFVQEQFAVKSAQTLAQAINAEIVTLDHLAEDYSANLREVAQLFLKAMQP